ncbi:hypothetical protein N7G274_004196 [Stereocaulon virgatum]|uniref:Uncharacterized protein n=1 Tax=Stereocaulon virgatum TaxID=373712 RepID=A0ABR4ACD3_9LECA
MVEPIWERNSEDELEPARHRYRHQYSEVRPSGSTAPWTSARCNRLLRPISSKIAALRKTRQTRQGLDEKPEEVCQYNGYRTFEIQRDLADKYGRYPSYSATSVETTTPHWGNEWMSSPRMLKRIKHTYSSKTRNQLKRGKKQKQNQDRVRTAHAPRETEIGLPRDFAFSTCEVNATLSTLPESNPYLLQKTERKTLLGVARRTTSKELKLIDGICKGLVALLEATSDGSPFRNGCRSLFSTCLTQVPAYIDEEEMLSRIDDPTNDDDISSAVYNDLEQFGSRPGAGWNPLREVVRAHGVSLVGEAIQEGAITRAEARHISSLCLAVGAYDEAQYILESLIATHPSADKQPSIEATLSVREAQAIYNSVEEYASYTGRQGFVYRQTTAMLNSGILPFDWMSSMAMIPHWNRMIRSITLGDEHALSATVLIQATLSRWYNKTRQTSIPDVHDIRMRPWKAFRRPALRSATSSQAANSADMHLDLPHTGISLPDDASDNLCDTIFNVLTVLSAIGLFRNSESAQSLDDPQRLGVPILHDLGLEVRQALELASYNTDSKHVSLLYLERLRLPLLAAGISTVACKDPTQNLHPDDVLSLASFTGLPTSSESLGNAGLFLCAIARCCAKARSVDAFDFIKAMVNDLMALSSLQIQGKATTGLWGQIALAAAFEFSEDTSLPDHLNWALDVELAINGESESPSKLTFEKTPARGIDQRRKGYRWEEGICEWIAKTPALALQKPSDIEAGSRVEETAATPIACLKQVLSPLSELTPCAMNKKPTRAESQSTNAYMKAFDIYVNAEFGSFSDENALDELRLATAYQHPPRVRSDSRPFRNIYLDDDVDELSAPGSSQENSLTLSALQELPDKRCGVKRKMYAGVSQGVDAFRTSRRSAKYSVLRVPVPRLEIHALDLEDELGFL